VERKRGERYSQKFRGHTVERMNACENILRLSRELGIHRRLLYKWRDQLELTEVEGESTPQNSREHSDRGVQYACEGYIRVLRDHQMMPSMSRPGNPYDNASCESFIKTLKREEIYANDYRDLEHMVESVEKFIEYYYNRCRLHSALGYRPPEEFEEESAQRHAEASLAASTVTFARGRQ